MKPNPVTVPLKPNESPLQSVETDENGSYEVNLSAEFEDLEETTESNKIASNQNQKLESEVQEKHYIIPGTMFEGQFEYIKKQKKQQDVEQQLEELQDQKRQLEISTQHYINPTTVVQCQVKKGGKQQKNQEVEKQLNKMSQQNQQNRSMFQNKQEKTQIEIERPKFAHKINLHEFNSNEVPELHQQDLPVNLQQVEVNQSIYQGMDDPTIKSIKPLMPIKLESSESRNSSISSLKPVSLVNPLESISQQKRQKQKIQTEEKHYIIPGTCFEGQFQYVTKEKKQEDVENQLRQLEDEKRQLQISTQHYIKPTKITEGRVPDAIKQHKQQSSQPNITQTQNHQSQKRIVQTHKYQQTKRSSFVKNQVSQSDVQGLKLLKGNSKDKKFIKMQIQSDQEGKLPYKIDQYTCMTVLSLNQQQKPYLNLPFAEQPNDDLEIIVIETSLNKEATGPKDLVNEKAKDVLGNKQMQSLIGGMKNRDGSPVKVVIGTKQFANYPGQSAPSPAIIDETTLSDLRIKNNSEFLQKRSQKQENEVFYTVAKNNEDGNPEEIQIGKMNAKENKCEISDTKKQLELEHLHVTIDVDKIKKIGQNGKKGKPIIRRIVKSAIFSSLVGGLVWLSFKQKNIAAASTATSFALALLLQKQ